MAYFAELDSNNVVLRVIVADQAFIDSGLVGASKNWLVTAQDGSVRKNYAGVGHVYDKTLDAFIPPKAEPSFVLNTQTAQYEPPIPKPADGKPYIWDEPTLQWNLDTEDINKEAQIKNK